MDAEERWRLEDTNGRFHKMLKMEGYAQMRAAFLEYERISGLDVAASVSGAMEEDSIGNDNAEYWDAVIAFVKCLRNCPSFFAENLHTSLQMIEKQGHDESSNAANTSWAEKTLIRCLITRCEADLPQILRMYRKRFGTSLYTDIDLNCKLLYKDLLLEVIKSQGQTNRKRQANGHRIAGMIIRGPPPQNTISRPPQTSCTTERLQNSPLNKQQAKLVAISATNLRRSNENRRGFSKRRGKTVMNDTATVQQARDFNVDKDVDAIGNALRVWKRDGYRTVLTILGGRSNEQRQKLRMAYASRHKRDLVTDLQKTIGDDIYSSVITDWMKAKVEFDATALYQALRNESKLEVAVEILCTRPNKHMKNVIDAFRRLYGSTVSEAICERTYEGFWQKLLMALANSERDITNSVSVGLATQNATNLYEDEIAGLGGARFLQIFTKSNFSQIRATLNAFKKVSGKDLQEVIKDSPDANDEKKKAMDSLVRCCKDPAAYFCDELHFHLMQNYDGATVCRIFLSRAEVDLELIKQLYFETYGRSIKSDLNLTCKETYKEFLLHLLSPNLSLRKN